MRHWIQLFEDSGTVTLYRGDNAKIERFILDKTDENALLGMGIYLTDSPEIAKDYTVKGKDGIAFRAGYDDGNAGGDGFPKTPHDLIRLYLRKILRDNGVWDELEEFQDEWRRKFFIVSSHWGFENGRERDQDVYQAKAKEWRAEYEAIRSKLIKTRVQEAKQYFAKQRPNLRIIKLTTGEYVFVYAKRGAMVASFDVPRNYIDRCLHAERPLPDDALAVIREAFLKINGGDPNKRLDLRILTKGGEEIGATFDDFITGYKKTGSRYAWTEKRNGGRGENPTLDILWNGTHSGYHAFGNREAQRALMAGLMQLGYVGLQYDGGVRLAGTGARGGGGVLHNAYVFWDEDQINDFRRDDSEIDGDDVGELQKGIRAKSVVR